MTNEERILVHALVRFLVETLDLDDEDLEYMTVGDAVAEIDKRGELPEHPEHFGRAIDLVEGMLLVVASRVELPERHVRQGVARNTSTPADVLAALAGDAYAVRCYVALNTSTSADVFAALARDEDAGMRWRVALNTSTPAEVFAALVQDEEWYVRQGVADNTSTPADVLAALAGDEVANVRESAHANLVRR